MLLIDSYIDINRCHPKLSMDLLIKEKKHMVMYLFHFT